jgi:1,4-dihydroxy-2-naphthoyl-CoA synthase
MSKSFDICKADYERFSFERAGRVLTASIDSGHPMNPVDSVMHDELATVFTDLQRDTDSDIIILTAKGGRSVRVEILTGLKSTSQTRPHSAQSPGMRSGL